MIVADGLGELVHPGEELLRVLRPLPVHDVVFPRGAQRRVTVQGKRLNDEVLVVLAGVPCVVASVHQTKRIFSLAILG